jgi:beta-glucosidase
MCSYNEIDGRYACENKRAMNGLLMKELGYPSYMLTDWNAYPSTAEAANAGLDMTMPGSVQNGGNVYWGSNLQSAVSSNSVTQARLDNIVKRILAAWFDTGPNRTKATRKPK